MKVGVLSYARPSYMGQRDHIKKLLVLTFRIQRFLYWGFLFLFIPMLSTKANMIFFKLDINHVAICMCNILKCWSKDPLPLNTPRIIVPHPKHAIY